MSEQQRRLVRLRDRYPTTSRMTRYRWKQDPDFPTGIDTNGTEFHREDELEAYEERRRRRKARPAEASLEQTDAA